MKFLKSLRVLFVLVSLESCRGQLRKQKDDKDHSIIDQNHRSLKLWGLQERYERINQKSKQRKIRGKFETSRDLLAQIQPSSTRTFPNTTERVNQADTENKNATTQVVNQIKENNVRSMAIGEQRDLIAVDTSPQPQTLDNQEESDRPLMYTYYEPAKTDMTQEADHDLLSNWKKAWHDEGWRPIVLTEADARRHPEFDRLIDLIIDQKHIGGYNMACYIRWIAMSAVGGGFISDYDTFPLNPFLRHGRVLPFDGKLTVYAGFVPALVSGSGQEYLRVAKKIGESLNRHVKNQKRLNLYGPAEHFRNHLPWSDMLALNEIYQKISADMYIQRRDVLDAAHALQKVQWEKSDCEMSEGKRAIHFSHKAIRLGKQAFRGAIHRGTIARKFLNMWRTVCNRTLVSDT